jgi:glycosyltransferase involved in cell wall biosynthesis
VPLRVLFVTPNAPPSTGGVEMHVREIGRRLPALGVEVDVLTVDARGDRPAAEELDGLRIRRVRGWPTGRDWYLAPGLVGAIRRTPADLVHVHSYQTLVPPLALAAAAWAGRPTVLTFHSGGSSSGWRRSIRPLQTLLLSPFLRAADGLVAVSPFEAELFAHRLRMPVSRIHIIRNGADLPAPSAGIAPQPGLLVSVGRVEGYKGHRRAVAALAVRAATQPTARLRILGDGPDAGAVRHLAEELGVADRVEIGAVPSDDRQGYADALAMAEAVLVLSDYESQGIAAWEAATLGRPLVVTETTALAELAALGVAVGVRPDDPPEAIAAAVEAALADTDDRPRPVMPTWDRAADALRALYAEVLTAG